MKKMSRQVREKACRCSGERGSEERRGWVERQEETRQAICEGEMEG
jgi:hypothetical protein